MQEKRRLRFNWRVVLLYLLLFALAIPWYWPSDDLSLWLGMPAWVTIALFISILVSILTAIILLRYAWPGESDDNQKPSDQ